MKEYLFKLGINAKKTLNKNINTKKKNKVLKDYIDLICNSLNIKQ